MNCKEGGRILVSPFKLPKAIVSEIGNPLSMKRVNGGIYIEIKDYKQTELLKSITHLFHAAVETTPNDRLNHLHVVITFRGPQLCCEEEIPKELREQKVSYKIH